MDLTVSPELPARTGREKVHGPPVAERLFRLDLFALNIRFACV